MHDTDPVGNPSTNRRITLVAVAVTVVALVLPGCAAPQRRHAPSARQPDGKLGTSERYAIADRVAAPKLTGQLLDGERFDLAEWRGKIVVINFWGSWCAPCRLEAPRLEAAYRATTDSGVEFLGVDVRDGRDAAQAFEKDFGITYPSLFDPAGHVAVTFRRVPPNVVPATLVLDRRHRVAAVFRRAVEPGELEKVIGELMAESPD